MLRTIFNVSLLLTKNVNKINPKGCSKVDLFIPHVQHLPFTYPPILLSLTYNIKHSLQFHQISLPIPHTTCIYARHARPVTVFTQNLVRESWFIQNLRYNFLPLQYFRHFTPLPNKFAHK